MLECCAPQTTSSVGQTQPISISSLYSSLPPCWSSKAWAFLALFSLASSLGFLLVGLGLKRSLSAKMALSCCLMIVRPPAPPRQENDQSDDAGRVLAAPSLGPRSLHRRARPARRRRLAAPQGARRRPRPGSDQWPGLRVRGEPPATADRIRSRSSQLSSTDGRRTGSERTGRAAPAPFATRGGSGSSPCGSPRGWPASRAEAAAWRKRAGGG